MTEKKIKIIYCMGAGRSGSTVLNILLGSHPDIIGAGELQNAGRVFINNEYCSCGEQIRQCEFWSKVFDAWNDKLGDDDIKALLMKKQKVENFKSPIAWLKMLLNYPGQSAYLQEYYEYTYRFFLAIANNGKEEIITDISKNPLRAWALMKNPYLDLRLIHLVRDGRSLAWSLMKTHEIDKKAGLEKQQKARPVWRTALFWLVVNRMGNFVRSQKRGLPFIRYEDLTLNPENTLREIGKITDVDVQPILNTIQNETPLPVSHVMSGNKLRMAKKISLRHNEEWKSQMPRKYQASFYRITRSTMRNYGYRF